MKIIDIKKAVKLLESGYVLESFENKDHYVFVLDENKKIKVASSKYSHSISIYDFNDIYKEFNFSLIEGENIETIDLEKDKEYYSKIQKHQ